MALEPQRRKERQDHHEVRLKEILCVVFALFAVPESLHYEIALQPVIPSGGGAERRRSRGIPRSLRVFRSKHSPENSGDPSTRPSEGLAQDDRKKLSSRASEASRGIYETVRKRAD